LRVRWFSRRECSQREQSGSRLAHENRCSRFAPRRLIRQAGSCAGAPFPGESFPQFFLEGEDFLEVALDADERPAALKRHVSAPIKSLDGAMAVVGVFPLGVVMVQEEHQSQAR
jgi:hypothetical protein